MNRGDRLGVWPRRLIRRHPDLIERLVMMTISGQLRCSAITLAQDGLDEAAKAADRTTTPVRGDGVALDAIKGNDPARVGIAFVGEIGGDKLMEARDDKRLLKLQRELQNVKLLIVDELGYVPLSPAGGC